MPFSQAAGQSSTPPQPLPMRPQYCCSPIALSQVTAVGQFVEPHTLGMSPPPQVVPAGQVVQSSVPPQPLPIIPQYVAASLEQRMGVQSPGETSRGIMLLSRGTMTFVEESASAPGNGPASISPPGKSSGDPPQPIAAVNAASASAM